MENFFILEFSTQWFQNNYSLFLCRSCEPFVTVTNIGQLKLCNRMSKPLTSNCLLVRENLLRSEFAVKLNFFNYHSFDVILMFSAVVNVRDNFCY
jgi:hypothetical protein